ncbi:EAL domain-containing protein [Parasphingorhabdus sp.]|uniref:putative bifunctional diguanylate cyclase/phosphodiesterase n=1 Tax=Parasphingorhabdus sp. TaxID=2709688 RepID=UPI0032668CB3
MTKKSRKTRAKTSEDLSIAELRLLGVSLDLAESPLTLYGKNETLIYANAAARSFWPITIAAIENGMTRKEASKLQIKDLYPNFSDDKLNKVIDIVMEGFDHQEPTQLYGEGNRLCRVTHHHIGDIAIAGIGVDITELHSKKLEVHKARELAEFKAAHDSLTSLPNRSTFKEIVEIKINEDDQRSFWLLMCDVDKFKLVNDVYGHDIGDKVIMEFAEHIKSSLGQSVIVSRLGGDEFAVFVCDQGPDRWERHRLEKAINENQFEIKVGDQVIGIEFSCGAASFPADSETYKDLLKCADLALLRSKKRPGRRIDFYDSHLGRRHVERLSLMTEFEDALRNHQIIPYFQPIIDIMSGELRAIEALVRWQHSDRGLLTPMEFQKIFKDRDYSLKLSQHMLKSVTSLMTEWLNQNLPVTTVNLNIEASDLLDPAFMANLLTCSTSGDLSPAYFGLEITENSILNVDNQALLQSMNGIRDMGIKIVLDDFGTGFSSISHLDHLPITGLKLDKSYVQKVSKNDRSRKIVRGIVSLAKDLNLETVAEGIETEQALEEMSKLGCTTYQGYYFSYPLSPDEMLKFLVAQRSMNDPKKDRRIA